MSSHGNKCRPLGDLFVINYAQPTAHTIHEWCLLLRRGPSLFDLSARDRNEYQLNKFKILTLKQGFQEGVAVLRERFIVPAGLAMTDLGDWSSKAFKPIEDFVKWGKDIDRLLRSNQASDRWKHAFEFYVIFNSLEMAHLIPRRYAYTIASSDDLPETIHLEIHKDTSQKDLLKIWKEISKVQELLIDPGMTKGERYELSRRYKKASDPMSPDYLGGRTEHRLQRERYNMVLLEALGLQFCGVKKARKAARLKEFDRYQKTLQLKKDGKTDSERAKDIHKFKSDSPKIGRDEAHINELIEANVLY